MHTETLNQDLLPSAAELLHPNEKALLGHVNFETDCQRPPRSRQDERRSCQPGVCPELSRVVHRRPCVCVLFCSVLFCSVQHWIVLIAAVVLRSCPVLSLSCVSLGDKFVKPLNPKCQWLSHSGKRVTRSRHVALTRLGGRWPRAQKEDDRQVCCAPLALLSSNAHIHLHRYLRLKELTAM